MAHHHTSRTGRRAALALLTLSLLAAPLADAGLFRRSSSSSGESQRAPDGEFILLSGGPALREWEDLRRPDHRHDRWWGNFIRPARARIQALQKEYGPNVQITWLVYRPGYVTRATEDGDPLISWIESVRDKYRVRLVWIDSGEDVIRYLNSGQNRRRNKVALFEYYGHSNRHAFMFDYSNDISGASTAWLHERDLGKIRRSAFDRDAECRSYGCHTGESMSRVWREATGVRMWGAMGKTDYSDPLNPKISPGGFWKY